MIRLGRLRAMRVGWSWRVRGEDLEAYREQINSRCRQRRLLGSWRSGRTCESGYAALVAGEPAWPRGSSTPAELLATSELFLSLVVRLPSTRAITNMMASAAKMPPRTVNINLRVNKASLLKTSGVD
jgi:hypothetical protein